VIRGADLSRWQLTLALATGFLAILPILAAHHLPLLDAQGHESRLVVLHDLLISRKGSQFYALSGFFLPNIAFDVVGLGLVGSIGPENAGRVFFALTLLLTLSGVWVLNRIATGRWSLAPLAASLVLYNLISILGFFSYALGLALVPWALAGRLWLGQDRDRSLAQAAFGAAAGVLLLFCHVFDFGIYAVMVTGMVAAGLIQRRIGWSRAVLAAISLVPALALFLLMAREASGHAHFEGSFLAAKLFGLLKSVTCASLAGDLTFVAGAALLAALIAFWSRPRLELGFALGLAGLALLYMALPDKLATGSYVDKRMPIAFGLLLLAGLDIQVRRTRTALAIVCLIGVAVAGKQVAIAALWRSFDPVIDQMAQAFQAMPAGAVLLQAECEPEASQVMGIYRERQPSLTHVSAMAAFGDARFAAATWAIAGQHTIQVKPDYRDFYDLQESFGSSTCAEAGYRAEIEQIRTLLGARLIAGNATPVYFLLIRPTTGTLASAYTKLIASAPLFALYEINPPAD